MKLMKKAYLAIFLLLFLIAPNQSWAQLVPCGGSGQPDCQLCHIFVLLNNLIAFVLTRLVPTAAALMIVIGGLAFLISGADPAKLNKAKQIVWAAVIGLVVIFLAWVFINTFLDAIGVADWTGLGTWWEIDCP
jgi:predicted small integral membrane protein